MTQALQGIRVIDFTQVEMGPVCTQVLGDFGADVIKVERPVFGDISRGKPLPVEGESPVFLSLNRNKRGLAVDLKRAEGQAIILRLVDSSDVLVHNFRPEVATPSCASATHASFMPAVAGSVHPARTATRADRTFWPRP